jgi:hypothetical protein
MAYLPEVNRYSGFSASRCASACSMSSRLNASDVVNAQPPIGSACGAGER